MVRAPSWAITDWRILRLLRNSNGRRYTIDEIHAALLAQPFSRQPEIAEVIRVACKLYDYKRIEADDKFFWITPPKSREIIDPETGEVLSPPIR